LPALLVALGAQAGLAAFSVLMLVAYYTAIRHRGRTLAVWLGGAITALLIVLALWARAAPEPRLAFDANFLYPFQLLSAVWGQETPFQLGVVAVGLSMVALALKLSNRTGATGATAAQPTPFGSALWFWASVLIVLVLLSLPAPAFVWRATGLDSLLTYPWQVLALTGLPLAFLAGSVVRLDQRLATLPAWSGLLALVMLASYSYLAPTFTRVDPGSEPVAIFQPEETDAPQIMLLDHALAPPTAVTPTLTLTLTWQAVEPVAQDYTVFIHLLAPDGSKVAQRDARPCDGECPTNTWQPGELVLDRYQLEWVPKGVPGPYRLAIGLYLLETGERAVVLGRDDRTVFLDVP
jgi:hypothetical protein